jgi:hypothetical protein
VCASVATLQPCNLATCFRRSAGAGSRGASSKAEGRLKTEHRSFVDAECGAGTRHRYYKLGINKKQQISGGWMCEDEFCSTCAVFFEEVTVGTAGTAASCTNYHQVWFSKDVAACTQECTCAAEPPGPPAPPGGKGYVYLNQYRQEDSAILNCELGQNWQEAVISRVNTGCHRFTHGSGPSYQDTYRSVPPDDVTASTSTRSRVTWRDVKWRCVPQQSLPTSLRRRHRSCKLQPDVFSKQKFVFVPRQ